MNDNARFLIKVILLSVGISLLIKLSGTQLSVETLDISNLNRVATILILLPSLVVGSILAVLSRRSFGHSADSPSDTPSS